MELFRSFMEPCTILNKIKQSDGMGGFTVTWQEGAVFDAAVVKDESIGARIKELRIAEKKGPVETFTVTTNKGLGLEYHDVFKRNSDGATFLVTANAKDSETPDVAGFSFEQAPAERWDLV